MTLLSSVTNYWKLDESSGNAADSVGGITLTNTNVTYGTGKINNGAIFNSAHTSQLVGSSNVTPTTINFWINATALFVGATGYTVIRSTTPDNTIQGQSSTGNILIYDGTSNRVGTNTWVTGAWTMYTFIYSTSPSNGYDVYQNGTFLERIASNQVQFRQIGRSGSLSPQMTIDEVGLFSAALTPTEVRQLYNSNIGLQYPFTWGPANVKTIGDLGRNDVGTLGGLTMPSVKTVGGL